MVTDAFDSEDRPNFTDKLNDKDIDKFVSWLIKQPDYESSGMVDSKITKIEHFGNEFDGVAVHVQSPKGGQDIIRITNFEIFSERKRLAFNSEYFIRFMYTALEKCGRHKLWKDIYVGQKAYNAYSTIFDYADEIDNFSYTGMPRKIYPNRCASRKVIKEIKAVLKSKEIKRAFNYDVEAYVNRVLGLGAPEDAPGGDE